MLPAVTADGAPSLLFTPGNGRWRRVPGTGAAGIARARFQPDGSAVAAVLGDGVVRTWDVRDGAEVGRFTTSGTDGGYTG